MDEKACSHPSWGSKPAGWFCLFCGLETRHDPRMAVERADHEERLRRQAEADVARLSKELEDEMQRNAVLGSRLDNILSAIRRCAGELEFDNFNVKGDPGGYCSECGRGASAGHDPLCWRRYAFVVERHVHDFKPSALLKGERVCACGEYRYDSE